MTHTVDVIYGIDDFEYAPDGWMCLNHPEINAVGVLYYWCGNPECCAPPAYYLCEECLVKQYEESYK